jgi:uncharacterized protein YkwD
LKQSLKVKVSVMKRSAGLGVRTIILFALFLASLAFMATPFLGNVVTQIQQQPQETTSQLETLIPPTEPATPRIIPDPCSNSESLPQNENTYPNQDELVQFALDEINYMRTLYGLTNVTLSKNPCGQLHAEEMLENRYMSHWNLAGYKPYMRYTEAGGTGSVSENVGYQYNSYEIDQRKAIRDITEGMMYNDAEWDWGHRDNILDPRHNRVSLGVAYDENYLYLVQDFEDYYFKNFDLEREGKNIRIELTVTQVEWEPSHIQVHYDPHPKSVAVEDMNTPPYNGAYNGGQYIGVMAPENMYAETGVTVSAEEWSVAGRSFLTYFNLQGFYKENGKGVYTLYLYSNEESWTTISIWLN